MLWYKFWLEGRFRFLSALFWMVAYCALVMPLLVLVPTLHAHAPRLTQSYIELINTNVYYNAPVLFFLVFAALLGVGGLSRERSGGSAAFTLSFPVSRWRIVATGAAVGLIETGFLALSPAVVVMCLSYTLCTVITRSCRHLNTARYGSRAEQSVSRSLSQYRTS
jgi:ABC-2 type transport system permease protein